MSAHVNIVGLVIRAWGISDEAGGTHLPVIPASGRLKADHHKFPVNPGFMESPFHARS